MRREAAEIRKSAQNLLPYDLDKYLTPQLDQLAQISEGMAKELENLLQERDLLNKRLGGKLDELARRLASDRGQFDERVTKPLEDFEAVFPLLADQERFIMLVQWQDDFADRLASLKGRDGKDNPGLKARMRNLEQEQRQIEDALAKLLDDIQEHSEKLPDKPELAKLRQTALKFVHDVTTSGASEAMAMAEAALAEFAPTRGHQNAQDAADILKRFIKRCRGMGNDAAGTANWRFSHNWAPAWATPLSKCWPEWAWAAAPAG